MTKSFQITKSVVVVVRQLNGYMHIAAYGSSFKRLEDALSHHFPIRKFKRFLVASRRVLDLEVWEINKLCETLRADEAHWVSFSKHPEYMWCFKEDLK